MRKMTLGRHLKALNGKEMTLSHILEKMATSQDLRALNRKEMIVGHKSEKLLWVVSFGLEMEKK